MEDEDIEEKYKEEKEEMTQIQLYPWPISAVVELVKIVSHSNPQSLNQKKAFILMHRLFRVAS